MEFKQDVGSAVKNKLNNLKDNPDDLVWTNIEAHLKKKKKRRGIIIWLFSGTLGLLLILFLAMYPFSQTIENIEVNYESKPNKNYPTKTKTTITNKVLSDSNFKKVTKTHKIAIYKASNYNNPYSSKSNKKKSINSSKNTEVSAYSINQKSGSGNISKSSTTNPTQIKASKSNNETGLIKSMEEDISEISNEVVNDNDIKNAILIEEEKDKNLKDDISKWSVMPQIIGSNYGAFNATTTKEFTINYGILANYRMTKSTYLRIGVRKLDLQQTIGSTINNLKYLEFPIEVKYAPFYRKINPYFTSGLSYFVLQEVNSNNLNTSDYRATISFNLGLGLETKLFNKFYINLEPNFNYQMKPFTVGNEIKPYILSIQTGLEYRF
ncbi:outer membrane beta-barrel protein [Winogradskyella sp. PE311]|uniref:outer membrane beta-barrel protein n=1 Tax=Winogradskyella sp. PE311 TaxID=3366943 RepID=UPI0039814188